MRSAVRVLGATKSFGGVEAVKGLDWEVPAGALCGFLGPNGAGKSTTIRMLMSILAPDEGAVEVLGQQARAVRHRIGYLPEERGLYRRMPVGEFLMYLGRLRGLSRATLAQRIPMWLERVALSEVVKRPCHTLSKGMQQKIQFIAAVLHEPELLILDEPFSGLDPLNVVLLNGLIRELHQSGTTILFSTHTLTQAESLCDRFLLIHRGCKLLDASLAEIRERFDPRTIEVEPLGATPDWAALPQVVKVEAGRVAGQYALSIAPGVAPQEVMASLLAAAPLRSLALGRATLEDVFVASVLADQGAEEAARAREVLRHA